MSSFLYLSLHMILISICTMSSRLNLSTATDAQLHHLATACEPATFGRDQKDVHDETYRKAGKLDKTDFLLAFDAEDAGLIDTVREELAMPRYKKDDAIRAEMYKLNVYGASKPAQV